MYVQEHNIEQQNHVNIAWFHSFTFTGKGLRKGWRTPLSKVKYSEQRDEEKERSRGPFASERGDEPRSGIPYCSVYSYTYFGARYMDHELMTMWLSVDPMADKYPSISPYAYCAWNPVKLIDPDGREIDISSFFDENGKVKQDCLFAYKALSYFANTRFGYRALALFAKKGQKIAGREFTEDGLYHQDGIDLSFRVGALSNGRSASGETGTEITGRGKSRRMRITISLCTQVSGGERTNVPSYLETICHEMFFHAFIFAEDYTDDGLINDSQISPALKSCAYRNDRQELQDLDYNLRYRNYAIPIMTEYFKGQKTVAQTIDWMSKQGQNFIHRPNWHKTR